MRGCTAPYFMGFCRSGTRLTWSVRTNTERGRKKRERKVDKEHGMRYKYREEEIVIKIQKQRERRVGK